MALDETGEDQADGAAAREIDTWTGGAVREPAGLGPHVQTGAGRGGDAIGGARRERAFEKAEGDANVLGAGGERDVARAGARLGDEPFGAIGRSLRGRFTREEQLEVAAVHGDRRDVRRGLDRAQQILGGLELPERLAGVPSGGLERAEA